MSVTAESSERSIRGVSQSPGYDLQDCRKQKCWTIGLANLCLACALLASIASWLSSIRSPLWLDETVSFWQINGGFRQIWARQGLSFPAYSYILWATKLFLGRSEVALRLPSVCAMVGAAYILYRIAREFFDFDVAVIVVVVFCLHPIVSFAAVDARPYAFGILTVNCAILSLLRWIKTNSIRCGILFGVSSAAIFYFHYLFGVILLAFALLLAAAKEMQWKSYARNLKVVGVPFLAMLAPVFSRLFYMVQTSRSHVFGGPPRIADLLYTAAPGVLARLFAGAIFVAAVLGKIQRRHKEPVETGLTALLLAAIPLMFLYGVSSLTSLHVFIDRYRLVAIPGITLCWGLLVNLIDSRVIRLGFCIVLVALTLNEFGFFAISFDKPHGYTWKYALAVANANSASDKAPILLCSDLPESDFEPMPDDPRSSGSFAPISYYPVNSQVIPLPRSLNDETKSQVNKFLAVSVSAHRRFLALAYTPSKPTIDWLTAVTKGSYLAQPLGIYDGVTVMQYLPR